MNPKTKSLLLSVGLVVVVGGAVLLYNTLGRSYKPPAASLAAPAGASSSAAASAAAGASSAQSASSEPLLAPDFAMEDAEGNIVRLSDFAGKPVVLNFWASWCPPCRAEMPEFDAVWKEMGDDVVFLMVNATDGQRETKEKGMQFIADKGFSFPVYYDTTQEAAYVYGISSLPTTAFIDANGSFVTGYLGQIDEQTLRSSIALIAPEAGQNSAAQK